jgi:amino acid adenylation domain-containing protein
VDGPVAGRLRELARETLSTPGLAAVGEERLAEASFVRLGGDSLAALTLAGRAECELGVRLRVSDLLSDTPLGRVVDAAAAPGSDTVMPDAATPSLPTGSDGGAEPTPVSPLQEGMWLADTILGARPYSLLFTCHLAGALDAELLDQAVAQTVRRHDGLRTIFPVSAGRVARVVSAVGPGLDRAPVDAADDRAFDEHVQDVARQLGAQPYDLRRVLPVRFTLVTAGTDRHALILAVHHILLDGWSIALVLREIVARYDALVDGGALPGDGTPPVSAAAYDDRLARLRARGVLAEQKAFWQDRLADVPDALELPSAVARAPMRSAAGARLPVDLGAELTGAVRSAASAVGVTSTAFVLAALALSLARLTGVERLAIGMPVAGRPPELAELVGVTVNLLPVRVDVAGQHSVRDYLRSVQDSLSASLDHEAAPFADIVQALGVESSARRHPLVQVAFGVHHDVVPARIASRHLEVRVEEGHAGGSQFDLELFLNRSEPTLAGHVEYATDVWDAADAAGFVDSLRATLASLAADPDVPTGQLRAIGPDGRRRLAELAAGSAGPAGNADVASLDDRFRAQVAREPDAPAVRDGDLALSYSALDGAVDLQAQRLRRAGVGVGDTVLIACQLGAAEIVAVLAAARVGAAYCGLDRQAPRARVAQLVATLRPAAVVGAAVAGCDPPAVPAWRPGAAQDAVEHVAAAPSFPADGAIAYVAFTSGSTGGPKGVCVPPRAVLRLVAGLDAYAPVGPGDRVLRLAPLSFDASTLEIWGALLRGAALEIGPDPLPAPAELGRFLADRRITFAWLTSGLFRLVVDFAADELGGLRWLLTGGDVVSAAHVRALLERWPGLTVVNGYGPTENTTFTTVHPMTDPDEVDDAVPIGRPVYGTGVHVVDADGRLAPPGAIGELYASGSGLATGYLRDPERTASVFGWFCPDVPERVYRTGDLVRLDSRGLLRFLGRRDGQVKLRGYRVELDEIRAAIARGPDVRDCLVLVSGQDSASRRLVAVVVASQPEVTADDLARRLSAELPSYLVPGLWAMLPELPVTANGKIDREAILRHAVPYGGASAADPAGQAP